MANIALEKQLEALAGCGFRLNPEIGVAELLISYDRASYEGSPYRLLIFRMGGVVEEEPFDRVISNDVWVFDMECIGGPGAYVTIARRLEALAAGPSLKKLRDHVDLLGREGWLEYTVAGQPRHHKFEVDDDWADLMVLSYLADDLETKDRHFFSYQTGQQLLLMCKSEAEVAGLRELTGYELDRLIPS